MGKNISKRDLLDFACPPPLQFLKYILLLVHGIFDNKKLLNSLKTDRDPSFSIQTLFHRKFFLNPFFYFFQHMVISSEFS